MHWIAENIGTIIAGAAVAAVIALAVFITVRRRKTGGWSCGCDGCANAANCGLKQKNSENKNDEQKTGRSE